MKSASVIQFAKSKIFHFKVYNSSRTRCIRINCVSAHNFIIKNSTKKSQLFIDTKKTAENTIEVYFPPSHSAEHTKRI